MATEADPVVGNWYQHRDKGQEFEVIAFSEEEGYVEVQHFDGDVESYDLEQWYDLDVELTEAPENWSGPYDEMAEDDTDYTETDMDKEEWERPLDDLADKD